MAFLDRSQGNPGQVLIVPKQHFENIYTFPPDIGAAIIHGLITLSQAVQKTFGNEGLSIWQSNSKVAGQEVFHIHFHIQPHWKNDVFLRVYPKLPPSTTEEQLEAYAQKIRKILQK